MGIVACFSDQRVNCFEAGEMPDGEIRETEVGMRVADSLRLLVKKNVLKVPLSLEELQSAS